MRTSTKITAVLGGTALSLATAGVAFAYWTTSGSGSGTGSTTAGVVNQLSFTQNPAGVPDTSVALAPMYPGDSAQTLTVRVRNTSTESTYVTSVKAYITTATPGCTGSDFLLGNGVAPATAAPSTAETARALTWTAADLAANGAANATGVVKFNNKADVADDPATTEVDESASGNQDVCKGAAVTIHYVAS